MEAKKRTERANGDLTPYSNNGLPNPVANFPHFIDGCLLEHGPADPRSASKWESARIETDAWTKQATPPPALRQLKMSCPPRISKCWILQIQGDVH